MSDLSLSLLGPFAASLDGKSLLPFRAKSVQALLIYLVCETERVHQREALMELLWPGMPLTSAQANMRQTLYRLRQAIPEVAGPAADTAVPFVVADRRTIQINPEALYTADVQQFANLIGREPERAITLYRGDFLADFYLPESETFEEWANGRRAHYQRQILTALDEVTAVHLQNSRYDAAEKLARQQLTIDNLRESGHRQLMEALARNGRRSDALAHYEIVGQLLQDELDIEPSPETRSLVQAIRAGELSERVTRQQEKIDTPEVRAEKREVETKPPSHPTPQAPLSTSMLRHNLPAQPTPFIGRESELANLETMMAEPKTRLITIVGPGGMGKTRLALAVAERMLAKDELPDGIFFVDLAPLNDASQIPLAVVDALHIQMSSGEGGTSSRLLTFLSDKSLLLILDNFEHLLAGGHFISEMLANAPGVQVLVTSRERLQLRQEQLYLIPGLAFPDWETPEDAAQYTAAQLFLEAAHRIRPDFQLTADDLTYLTRICRLVDGMPLALEMAAGWVELLSLVEITAEIEHGLDFLETDLQDVPDRHRSIQAIFASTWERLEPSEREIMQKLSVFRRGFTREAAGQVASSRESGTAILKLLSRLASKSLLQADPVQGRYVLHPLMRQYALAHLEQSGELTAVHSAHAAYFHDLLQQREIDIKGGQAQKSALDEIETDFANIRAAWDWSLAQADLQAIDNSLEALFWFFWFHSRQPEGVTYLLQIMSRLAENTNQETQHLQRRLLSRCICLDRGAYLVDPAEKLQDAESILADSLSYGEPSEIAFAYYTLGHAQIDFYDVFFTPEIVDSFEKSLSIYRELKDSFYESQVLDWYSAVLMGNNQPAERVQIARLRLEMAKQVGDKLTIADAQAQIGVDAEMAGRYTEAEACYQDALPVFREHGDRWHQAEYLMRLAGLSFFQGKLDHARALAEEGQAVVRRYNVISVQPYVKEYITIRLCHDEQYAEAKTLAEEPAQSLYPPTRFAGFRGFTFAYCGLGDFVAARQNLVKALEMALSMKALGWQAQLLPAAALLAAQEGKLAYAAELLALAVHHPAAINGWLDKFPLITRLRSRLEAELSPAALEGAQYQGRRLSLKETAESLLKELSAPDEANDSSVSGQDAQPNILHNLPPQPTPFIGRSAELAALNNFLADPDVRLVTIVGPGGMGKTRLALAAAERQLVGTQRAAPLPLSHGVFFVNLAPLNEPAQIVLTVADALNFPLQSDGRSPQQQLLDYLRQKQMLLLLDNFEHLLAGTSLLNEILQAAPEVKILVTSRERLHVRSEQVYPIEGLEFPDWETPEDAEGYTAVQLFLQSAHRNQPDFALRDNHDLTYLARICRTVAGMPLALELAAAWVDMLSLAEIAAGLQQGLDFLETDMRDVTERHRSVRAVIDYSWQKLDEKERDIFAKLSVFRGGFTRQTAQAVAEANLRQLGRLVNKSFLQYTRASDRYQIHELMRQYGLEKLQKSGQEVEVRDQHSQFFCTALQQWQAGLQSNQLRQTADAIEADYRNVEAAWEYALEQGHWERLLLAVNGLGTYFDVNGRWLEGVKLFQENINRLQPNQETLSITTDATRLLMWLSAWLVNLGINGAEGFIADLSTSIYQQILQSAFDLLQRPLLSDVDCRAEEAYLRLQLGRILKNIGGQREAGKAHLTICQQLYRELEDRVGMADALYESYFYFYAVDGELAQRLLQESLTHLQPIGDPRRLTHLFIGMASLKANLGVFDEADEWFDQAYITAQNAGYLVGLYDTLLNKGYSMQNRDPTGSEWALQNSEELLALAQQLNSQQKTMLALANMSVSQLYMGQFGLALDTIEEARRYESELEISDLSDTWRLSNLLPQVELHTGQYEKVFLWRKTFGDEWWIIIQEMWASLVKQGYEETLSLAQQVRAKLKLEPLNEQRGLAEMGSPLCLALHELGRKDEARRNLVQYLQICLELRVAFVQLMPLIPVIARVLADTEDARQKERAVELWAMAQNLPFVGNSQLFTDLLSQPMAEAAADLPSEIAAAARMRGQELVWWETATVLLEELKAWGWREEKVGEQRSGSGSLRLQEHGRFVQEELLATGGFGEVYRGRDRETGQVVVIKRLKSELVAQQPEALARFKREGELLRQLNHPNIVQMIATETIQFSEETEGEPCLIMEYVAGGSLRHLLDREGQLSVARTLDIALELADALSRAHHLGIIHRDLKPGNVLLAQDGTPRLTDFGIARMTQQGDATGMSGAGPLTQAGALLGTVEYMSPEACRGEELDGRADIWSFGVLLYEMLTGERPFLGHHLTTTITAILHTPIPDLQALHPAVPPALARLIEGMLVKEKEARIGRMRQVAAELDKIRLTI